MKKMLTALLLVTVLTTVSVAPAFAKVLGPNGSTSTWTAAEEAVEQRRAAIINQLNVWMASLPDKGASVTIEQIDAMCAAMEAGQSLAAVTAAQPQTIAAQQATQAQSVAAQQAAQTQVAAQAQTAASTVITMADGTIFDAAYYAKANPDVVLVYGTTDPQVMYQHYLSNGKKEGRQPFDPALLLALSAAQ